MNHPPYKTSELILNEDGSIYHLCLKPEDLAERVILVGDPGRVSKVSAYFDTIEVKKSNREFTTHTGTYSGVRMSVISTGIGTDNMDLVINELDALANIDLTTKQKREERKRLFLVRLGTSGGLQEDTSPGQFVISSHALGLDGLKYYYRTDPSKEDADLANSIANHLNWDVRLAQPYITKADPDLLDTLKDGMIQGITVTATGFYGPQGRTLSIPIRYPELASRLGSFNKGGQRITNMEMEAAALYLLADLLGHAACTCCVVLANRASGTFIKQHEEVVDRLIQAVVPRLARHA